jgi:excinuclease ABC subunit A
MILSPIVRGQKGEFKDLFADLTRQGYTRARVDGRVVRLSDNLKLDRNMRHDIEVMIDRFIQIGAAGRSRLAESVELALSIGDGHIIILSDDIDSSGNGQKVERQSEAKRNSKSKSQSESTEPQQVDQDSFSVAQNPPIFLSLSAHYACTECNISFEPPSPQLFSFNTTRGMCPQCDGLGEIHSFDPDLLIPDKTKSFQQGCVLPIGKWRELGRWQRHIFQGIAETLGKIHNISPQTILETAWEELDAGVRKSLLWGTGNMQVTYTWHNGSSDQKWGGHFKGIIPRMHEQFLETKSKNKRLEMEKYMRTMTCNYCQGERLNVQARSFKLETASEEFAGKKLSLPELCRLPINRLQKFFSSLALSETGHKIAAEALKEIRSRLGFLVNVGLEYLTLGRVTPTLSGGELQRIRLASQIGSGLVGVLYILDEPSIGLHPRDNDRLLDTIAKLRDLGNTVIVVEHDEDTMRAADLLIDFGPGPGVHGGNVVANILGGGNIINSDASDSLTLKYLTGEESIPIPERRRQISPERKIVIRGAEHNNLKNIDVEIPLGVFVCVTGVSGSGKSSLINDILVEGLNRDLNRGFGNPGLHRGIDGIDQLDKMIDIDQSPIGRGSHSNPATYIKVFDEIRSLFAEIPEAKMKGYEPGRFSFNVKGGRCEVCEGRGQLKLEMDFLADVYVTCSACQGRRFNHETLAIRYKGKSIDQVLNMDVEEAMEHFENHPKIRHYLSMLVRVGLGYMKLGQPSPTLSGGEAQRIKLARELVKRSTGKTLYLLDEPTTGLHFADIKMLLDVLHEFVDAGNTVLVVEHNLDVIKTADWVIDLGPEGGDAGGKLIAEGTPEQIAKSENSYTGKALKKYFDRVNDYGKTLFPPEIFNEEFQKHREQSGNTIVVRGASEHNLKNISVEIPRDKMTVCCGPSGSGKSSFAMDTIYAEGQRRYVESLSSYARQFIGQLQKPVVEHIEGLSPAIAIEQKAASHTPRSTVGTITEIQDYLRVLFARLGVPYCPACNLPVGTQTIDEIISKIMSTQNSGRMIIAAPVNVDVGQMYDDVWRKFRTDGFSRVRIDGILYSLDEDSVKLPEIDRRQHHEVELVIDRVVLRDDQSGRARIADSVESALLVGRGVVHVIEVDENMPELRWRRTVHSQHLACANCGRSFDRLTPNHFSANSPVGWCPACEGLGVQHGADPLLFVDNPKATLAEGTVKLLPSADTEIGAAMLKAFSRETGIPIDVPFDQLNSDHRRIIFHGTGHQVFNVKFTPTRYDEVEEDYNEVAEQDNVVEKQDIELPQENISQEILPPEKLKPTIVYQKKSRQRSLFDDYSTDDKPKQEIFPPETLPPEIADQKTLRQKLLFDDFATDDKPENEITNSANQVSASAQNTDSYIEKTTYYVEKISEHVEKISFYVEQTPFDHSELPESNVPAVPVANTDANVSATNAANDSDVSANNSKISESGKALPYFVEFSFKYKGVYPTVEAGSRLVPYLRLDDDVEIREVECGVCMGGKLRDDAAAVRLKGYTIGNICNMQLSKLIDVLKGLELSEVERKISGDLFEEMINRLQFLIDVGLDYLTLSRTAPTLSGGETQRIRLAAQIGSGLVGVLYVLDEPTIGLHPRDNNKLIDALKRLRDLGNTLLVVEHDKDVILGADEILDFGLNAGKNGGEIIAQGTPQEIIKQKHSPTGAYLSGEKQITIPSNRRISKNQSKSCPTRNLNN